MPMNTTRWMLLFAVLNAFLGATLVAQTMPPTTRPGVSATTQAKTTFKVEELEQLTAPIALYPDSLLAQVLMASTYPLEVVQAERWLGENKALKGDALTSALEKKDWDPSVKSLVNFPQVLTTMSKQLEWTTKLGDAFIADQASVMAAIQSLRNKAQAKGNLQTNEQQKVTVVPATQQTAPQMQAAAATTLPASAAQPAPTQIIQIESSSPDVVYVPSYDPGVVYGYWPYVSYPPYRPAPPPYGSNLISFGAGVAVGAAWGYAWGGCNWNGGDVDIDVNRNLNVNQNINRQDYANRRASNTAGQGRANSFQHDPAHRRGAAYRDTATARQYSPSAAANTARARESYRGRAETGRQQIASGGSDQFRSAGANLTRDSIGGAGSAGIGNARTSANSGRVAGAPSAGAPRSSYGGGGASPARSIYGGGGSSARGGNAFATMDGGGASARASSSRGQASRSAPARSAPARSAPARSGGGGRMGGGRR